MKRLVRHIRNFFRNMRRILINGLLLQGFQKKIPTTLVIEPTNICNFHCSCCPHGNEGEKGRSSGFMNRQIFDKIAGNIDTPVKQVFLYLHGEPFLNKDLDYFVEKLNQKKIITIIYSNGYAIDLVLLEKVLQYKRVLFSFSADIVSKENYEQIRLPAKYETMIEHLAVINRIFEAHKRKFDITVIVDNENFENIHEVSKKLFADYSCLKKISFGSKFPWPEHFYTGELKECLSKNRNLCSQIKGCASVYWDGKVTICSYDYSGKLAIGNLMENKLSEIYNSPDAKKIRKYHHLRQYTQLPVCQKCILPRYKSYSMAITRKQAMNEEYITKKL